MQTRSATRTSTGLPRKRPSHDSDDLRPSRAKARRGRKTKFPLMSLPAEIRLKILRELLWDPEPLRRLNSSDEESVCPLALSYSSTDDDGNVIMARKTSFDFHPAILAVCRQLNAEGSPILYEENVLDVKIAPQGVYLPHVHWMGPECPFFTVANISEVLRSRARKLKITIQVMHEDCVKPWGTRRAVRDLVMTLQDNPQWSSLEVLLERHPSVYLETEVKDVSQVDEEILKPFHTLRRINHVNFTGVSPQVAHRLSSLMTSDKPILDLPRMHEALYIYANRQVMEDDSPDDEIYSAEDAMDKGDEDTFYKFRDRAMWKVKMFLVKTHAKAFEYDPDPVSARLASLSSVTDLEALEKLQSA